MNAEVLRRVHEIPLGTHGILLWNETAQMVAAAKAFTEGGLERDEQVVFALVGHESEVESALKELGLGQEAVTIVDRARIEGVRSAAMEGDFGPRDLARRTLVEEAKKAGKSGVRIFANLSYSLFSEGRPEEALRCERSMSDSITQITTLCSYPMSRLDPEKDWQFFVDVLKQHRALYFPGIAFSR